MGHNLGLEDTISGPPSPVCAPAGTHQSLIPINVDDCVIYHQINKPNESHLLQEGLNSLS